MWPPLFEVDSEDVDCSTRKTELGEVRVTYKGKHTWYRIPFRQLTEFKHALRNMYGKRVSGANPYYIVKE